MEQFNSPRLIPADFSPKFTEENVQTIMDMFSLHACLMFALFIYSGKISRESTLADVMIFTSDQQLQKVMYKLMDQEIIKPQQKVWEALSLLVQYQDRFVDEFMKPFLNQLSS